MPYLEVTYQKVALSPREAFQAAKVLAQKEMAKHPEWAFTHAPEFRETAAEIVVVQPYKLNLAYVAPEPVSEEKVPSPPETALLQAVCAVVQLSGQVCGRDPPCRYHWSHQPRRVSS
jgi:hypothetical protein